MSASSSGADVLADLGHLLSKAARPTSRALLEDEISKRKRDSAASRVPQPQAPIAPPTPLRREIVEPSAPTFGSISKYAWDQGNKFVKVYLTLVGIEALPDAAVVCDIQPTALRFEVCGLPPPNPNMRLAVTLYSAVDPAKSSWVRKSDGMVLIKLRKAAEGDEWETLDDSAVQKAKRKAEEMANNKGKSTAELLSQMYANADEEGKASLAAAWEAGRSKREGRA